jgi:hypothetical protein
VNVKQAPFQEIRENIKDFVPCPANLSDKGFLMNRNFSARGWMKTDRPIWKSLKTEGCLSKKLIDFFIKQYYTSDNIVIPKEML